jgi:hypothetical protein
MMKLVHEMAICRRALRANRSRQGIGMQIKGPSARRLLHSVPILRDFQTGLWIGKSPNAPATRSRGHRAENQKKPSLLGL